jgi:prevent-host-death family protein
MRQFNIQDAKTNFSKIMRQVEAGDAVLVARDGVVIARIVPEPKTARIKLGCDVGRGRISDDFDAPLPEFGPYSK